MPLWPTQIVSKLNEQTMSELQGEADIDRQKAPSEVGPGLANRIPVATDYSQLSDVALRLMAETQGEGNSKYGYGNWQKGLPVSNLLSHAIAHILALQNGDTTTETVWQHIGHALWNLEKAAHFMKTRPELVDVKPLREAMGLDDVYNPPAADPNPDRNTNCWFCGQQLAKHNFKVIPPNHKYRQAHIYCYTGADVIKQQQFAEPL